MHCLDEQTILVFCRGSVPLPLRSQIEAHLGDCDECRTLVRALARASIPDASAEVEAEIAAEIAAEVAAEVAPPSEAVPGAPPAAVPAPRQAAPTWKRGALGGLAGLVFVGVVIAALEMRANGAGRPASPAASPTPSPIAADR